MIIIIFPLCSIERLWAVIKPELKKALLDKPLLNLTRDDFSALMLNTVVTAARDNAQNLLRANYESIRESLKELSVKNGERAQ